MNEPSPIAGRRVWNFADCSFDEGRWTLTVSGETVDIEAKPLEILLELLRHAGEVVTKEELFDAVWPGVTVVEGSLTTAISKLRKAIGDQRGAIVATVPRIGYRIDVPVTAKVAQAEAVRALPFEPGAEVPDRPNWRFVDRLDLTPRGEVWRIRHGKTKELHVVKYAADSIRLRALKREVALSRLLAQALGDRPDIVPVLDWNFDVAPYYLESSYGGPDLDQWATEQGGLLAIPMPVRLELVASVAATVAAAHGLGILHRDLKPANILIAVDRDGKWQARVVDFGSAALSEPGRLEALSITHSGFALDDALGGSGGSASSGTAVWMAPELITGATASVSSDIYALGVILYQLIVGDLRKPLAPGWEADIADPLLRDDIAAAAAGDPALRLDSAAELVRRLRSLTERQAGRNAAEAVAARAIAAERHLERVRVRRPWVIVATFVLAIGVIVSSLLYARAVRDRDIARRQTEIADKINRFLASDLLARSNPFRGAGEGETLVDAVKQASPLIDKRFAGEPAIAARLHQTIANALDKRSDWTAARAEYQRATRLWREAEGRASPDRVVARLQQAMMEFRSYEEGSVPHAKALMAAADQAIDAGKLARPDIAVWRASARGMAALIANDGKTATQQFGIAVTGADMLPDFDQTARLTFRQRLAFANLRLGDGATAERLFRGLSRDFTAIEGPDGPNVLMIGMNIAQALMVQARHAEAVAQANAIYPRLAARLGPEHEMTLQLLTTRAQSEGALESWPEAIRDDLAVHAIAVKKQGPKSFFAVATLSDAATAECRGGRTADGLRDATEANAMAQAAFGKVAITDAASYTVAECLLIAGRPGEAVSHLLGIDRSAVSALAADPNWGANIDLAEARIAAAAGDVAEARRLLKVTRVVYNAPRADAYQARMWRQVNAQVARARG